MILSAIFIICREGLAKMGRPGESFGPLKGIFSYWGSSRRQSDAVRLAVNDEALTRERRRAVF